MPKSKCPKPVVEQKFFKVAGSTGSLDIGVSISATEECIFLTGSVDGNSTTTFKKNQTY